MVVPVVARVELRPVDLCGADAGGQHAQLHRGRGVGPGLEPTGLGQGVGHRGDEAWAVGVDRAECRDVPQETVEVQWCRCGHWSGGACFWPQKVTGKIVRTVASSTAHSSLCVGVE